MADDARISIVMPLFDDEKHVSAALQSCLDQTLREIEIICVDDASTDGTVGVVEQFQQRDSRITLIRQAENRSAFQARRAGIAAASAPYVIFLDGDDELDARTAQLALAAAMSTGSDVVGFGVEIVAPDGVPTRLEKALQPTFSELRAPHIVPNLFPVGEVANGHLWRYLFSTDLLRAAYDGFREDLRFYRANDLPISFLALAQAKKYTSIPDRLYRYHFRRGTSGHRVDGTDRFSFLLSGIAPIVAIADRVQLMARESASGDSLLAAYESARLHIIANVLRYAIRDTSGSLQQACMSMMSTKVGLLDLVRAAAAFCPDALTAISAHVEAPRAPQSPQRVLLTTRRLDTGGLQNVLVDQAARLTAAGHEVTIAVLETADSQLEVPDGVEVVELTNANTLTRVDEWIALCRERSIDIVIDHHILYNEHWPWRTLAAIAIGIPTIGWLHNFALRPLFDQSNRISFLDEHLQTLLSVVTLSPTDVVFWKLRGQNQAVHLPNPPSPLAISALEGDLQPRRLAGRLELAWWGRLNATTKQVQHLVDIAAELRAREIDFRLTIVGPGSKDLSAMDVRRYAQQRGVGDAVELLGELDASELQRAVADAHLLVSTSAIEGYQLTLVEAQAMGMPVAMYDLPWLATVRGNPAVLTSQPDDPAALADLIAGLARDPERYAQLSQHAREHAQRIADVDLGLLLEQLLAGALPAEYSPAPSLAEASLLLDWSVRIGERNVKTAAAELAGTDADALRRDRDLARAQLRQITEGPSFRIGRAITKLPRQVRDLVRPAKKSSLFAGTATVVRTAVSAPPPPLRANPSIPTPGRASVPDVSFVIPVYNAEAWLEDCVTSVLAQTGIDVEVICIDDGSTDGSGRILSRLADADPRVTVIEQANSGQSVGRNRGLDAAAGRYLIYLDSDDYWPGDVAKRLVRSADESDLDLLLFDCIAFRDGDIDDKVWKRYSTYYQRAHTYREVRSGVQLMADMRRSKDYRPHVGLYMARTSFVRTQGVRFIPGIVHQDNPYTFRLMLHASRAAHESIDAYARRMRPGSTITTLNAERSARGYYLSYLEMTREMKNHRLPAQVTDPVNNIVDYVYDGARKQFALLDPAALDELRSLDLSDDAQRIFASLLESSRDA